MFELDNTLNCMDSLLAKYEDQLFGAVAIGNEIPLVLLVPMFIITVFPVVILLVPRYQKYVLRLKTEIKASNVPLIVVIAEPVWFMKTLPFALTLNLDVPAATKLAKNCEEDAVAKLTERPLPLELWFLKVIT